MASVLSLWAVLTIFLLRLGDPVLSSNLAVGGVDLAVGGVPKVAYLGCTYPFVVSGGTVSTEGRVAVSLQPENAFAVDKIDPIYTGSLNRERINWLVNTSISYSGNYYIYAIDDADNEYMSSYFNVVTAEATQSATCEIGKPIIASSTSKISKTSSVVSTLITASSSSSSDSSPPSSSDSSPPSSSSTSLTASTLLPSTLTSTSSEQSMATMPTSAPGQAISIDRSVSCKEVDPRTPDNWKCPSDRNCASANDASTGVCCAIENANCTAIFTIDCDVQLQNAATNPKALVFTTLLDGQLAHCGNGCCPFGFYCHHSDEETAWHCLMETKSSSINKTASELASIPKADPKAYVAPEETNTMSFHPPAPIPTLASGDASHTDQMNMTAANNQDLPVGTVAGIAVGSIAGLALTATAAAFMVRRRKKQDKAASGDLDIKPYQYSSNQSNRGAVNPGAGEAVVNKDLGYHVEKDGLPVQSPTLSPIMEKDGQSIQSPVQSPIQNPRMDNASQTNPRPTFFELA